MTWYTWQNGVQQGPFEEQQLRDLSSSGAIRLDSLVTTEGLDSWKPFLDLLPPTYPTGRCARCTAPYPVALLAAWGQATVCAYCKPRHVAELREGAAAIGSSTYASWGTRFAARMIDGVVLTVINFVIQLPMLGVAAVNAGNAPNSTSILLLYAVTTLAQMAFQCGYEVWFTTNKGATPGKLALHLQVHDSQGHRLSTSRALGRHFAHYISGLTLGIGYLLPLWDPEKRALHDMIADTRVVKK